MYCDFHPTAEAVTKCAICGADLCSQCDTNAFFRVEKGALCLECSLKEAAYKVAFDEECLKKQRKKVILAGIFIVLSILFFIIGDSEGMMIMGAIFWFLSGLFQTWKHEKNETSVKSVIWGDPEAEEGIIKIILKFIFYVFAAPVMLIVNLKKFFEYNSDLKFNIDKYGKINSALDNTYKQSFEYWEKEAEQGDPSAMAIIAIRYRKGKGVAQDIGKAIELLTKASEQGSASAQCELGTWYLDGEGVEKNYEKAIELLSKAANQGHDWAQNNLGFCYANGEGGVAKDYAKAVEWWTKAAEQGNPAAQCGLGICYQEGRGVVHNHAKAVELWTMAAAQGNEEAQGYLQQYS